MIDLEIRFGEIRKSRRLSHSSVLLLKTLAHLHFKYLRVII